MKDTTAPVTETPAAPPAPPAPAPAKPSKPAKPAPTPVHVPAARADGKLFVRAAAALILVTLLLGLAGCGSRPPGESKIKRVLQVTGALKAGVDPISQMPTLMLGRCYTEFETIPIRFVTTTNADGTISSAWYAPEVVATYEANGHGISLIGNLSGSSTIAVGTNSVNTIAGGQHPLINNATGLNNQPSAVPTGWLTRTNR